MEKPSSERLLPLLMGGMILWMIWGNTYWDAETRDWPSVQAKMFDTQAEHSGFFYHCAVAYSFELKGKEYYGTRYTSGPLGHLELDQKDAQRFLDRVKPGTTVTVFYDPQDPKRSAMAVPSKWNSLEMMVQVGFFLLAFSLINFGIRKRGMGTPEGGGPSESLLSAIKSADAGYRG